MNIGIAGLGRMGAAIAQRLVATGHQVVGWNRSKRAIAGLSMAKSLAALVEASDVILTSLFDGRAVDEVYQEETGLCASRDLHGKLFVETSTVAPESSRKTAAILLSHNGRFVDAPLLGTIGPCSRGELIAMVGGNEVDFREAQSVLAPLTRAVHHMGPVGAGAAAKLAVNLVMGSYWAAMGDSLALAARYSLNLRQLVDIIASGPAALAQLPAKRYVLDGEQRPVEFSLAGYAKDLKTMLEAAGPGVRLPILEGAIQKFGEALATGFGEQDVAAVALLGIPRDARLNST
jgi:3-hydroxyisobutyrate dehydrogenase